MTETYKSKVGGPIIIPIVIVSAMLVLTLVLQAWLGVAIMGVSEIFILNLFFNTYYTISGTQLFVKGGIVVNKTIDIATITKVLPGNNLLSSPALSLDRLEVSYNKYDSILVSPRDKAGFVAALKAINNNIIIS